jgi:hypothetical protein
MARSPAMIWGFPGREKWTTGCRESRRARMRDQRRRSLPATARGGGWRRAARRCASGLGIGVDPLQIQRSGEVRGMRTCEGRGEVPAAGARVT